MATLYHYPLCPFSRAIRLALGECGVTVRLESCLPWAPDATLLSLNPAGRLPVFQLEGRAPLCGSYAISEYLAETLSAARGARTGFAFFPGSAEERAEVRRLVSWFHELFATEVTTPLLEEKVYGALSGQAPPEGARLRAGYRHLRRHLAYLGELADARNWLAGAHLSYADLAAAGHLSCLDYLGDVPWDAFPAAKHWYMRLKSRPTFRPLLTDRIPGHPPAAHYAELDF